MAPQGSRTRVLTGITTSGTPHLGNYVGAIRPAVAASLDANTESFYFLAERRRSTATAPNSRTTMRASPPASSCTRC
jgi:tryptophanyl-tRNA synthetase